MYKYVILDFGKVLAKSATGYWDVPPKFLELIDIDNIDKELLKEKINKYKNIKSRKITNLEEEYNMFIDYYTSILNGIGIYDKDIIENISYDKVYNLDKYVLYDKVVEELEYLKSKYKLILLSDNFPSVIDYMKKCNIYNYFEKVYVSSIYGVEKKDGVFFDYVIKDFNIKDGDALFIDNTESNLDIAKEKGLDVLLIDRNNTITDSKYKIITDLFI